MPRDETLTNLEKPIAIGQPEILKLERPLRFLTPEEISIIDEFLSTLVSEGEVRLVVQKGRLRFVTRTNDYAVIPDGE
jgi:hypothetical protein